MKHPVAEAAAGAFPRLGASIAVWRGDEVLLVQRKKPPFAGIWSLPGGHVEPGETVAAAALRELGEETSVTAEVLGLVDVVDVIRRNDDGDLAAHYAIASFCGRYVDGTAAALDDAAAVRWTGFDALSAMNLTEGTEAIVRRSYAIACNRPS
ncbi:NUDIX hydrolase [Rhodobium gokarnense]|uniref:ADP-ribose pyrophosphatase YjhB (NUDIX family) n=1 Tax=Rhodobium gokarnense TaxID=364296 RepID=A0ABT3HHW8_9HYPH|nr:NUDIX hydrolase [Rhodobium gokarnense]MCW2309996.1 ADP-ribose pyrophosphatase YjhB (NUDIX family) [Rhodobium gokarnense]